MIKAVFSAIASALSLALFLIRRIFSPSPTEQDEDRKSQYRKLRDRLLLLRRRGDMAGADALLRRLRRNSIPPQRGRRRSDEREGGQ